MYLKAKVSNLGKHLIGDIWKDKKGETYIKTETGTKTYYRYLVEQFIGCSLPECLTVHHIDLDHTNNDIDNFLVIPTALHFYIHRVRGVNGLLTSNVRHIKKLVDAGLFGVDITL